MLSVRPERVAVVGAGIAGLTAARRLYRAGCDVVVLEKSRGVGGRASTRRCGELAFDHGAQYFTCRSDGFRETVRAWCRRGVAAIWDAPIATLGAPDPAPHRGESERYVGVPGMSALAGDLAQGLRVECGRRVVSLASARAPPGARCSRDLTRALRETIGRELPPVRQLVAHRWRFARTKQPLEGGLVWDAEARVGVCGDWTLGARVEDAFSSGDALARAMLGSSGVAP